MNIVIFKFEVPKAHRVRIQGLFERGNTAGEADFGLDWGRV